MNKPFCVLEDFNDNNLSNGSKMKPISGDAKLTQIITKPAKITPSSATLLDLIITGKSRSVSHSDIIPCSVADHELITV